MAASHLIPGVAAHGLMAAGGMIAAHDLVVRVAAHCMVVHVAARGLAV